MFSIQRHELALDLLVELEDLEVARRHAGNERQITRAPIRFGGADLGRLCLHALLDLAPDVDLPTDDRGDVELLREFLAGALLEARPRAEIEDRERPGLGLGDLRVGDLGACRKDLDVEVPRDRLGHQGVEIGVTEFAPPVRADRVGGRDDGSRFRGPRGFRRRVRTLELRGTKTGATGKEDRTSGQQEAPGSGVRTATSGIGAHLFPTRRLKASDRVDTSLASRLARKQTGITARLVTSSPSHRARHCRLSEGSREPLRAPPGIAWSSKVRRLRKRAPPVIAAIASRSRPRLSDGSLIAMMAMSSRILS